MKLYELLNIIILMAFIKRALYVLSGRLAQVFDATKGSRPICSVYNRRYFNTASVKILTSLDTILYQLLSQVKMSMSVDTGLWIIYLLLLLLIPAFKFRILCSFHTFGLVKLLIRYLGNRLSKFSRRVNRCGKKPLSWKSIEDKAAIKQFKLS